MQLPFRIQDNHLLCALCVLCGWRLRSEPQRAQGTQRTIEGTAFFVLSAFFVVVSFSLNHKERKEHKEHKEQSRERPSLRSLRSLWLALSV
jgi:Ca2+/Na+ antiporter